MSTDHKVLAVIPARGGSKRIPKKNIHPLVGKPLVAWTIEASLKSGLFEDVVVSTDSPEIAAISREYGASTPFNREAYADAHSPSSLVSVDAVNQLDKEYDIVVQLLPSCPLRSAETIIESYTNFIEKDYDFQLSCFKFGWMNPWWAYKIADEKPSPVFSDDLRNRRSQDQEELFCPSGAIWIAKTAKLLEAQTFYGEDFRMHPIPWKEAVDIDEYDDLAMAEVLYKTMQEA